MENANLNERIQALQTKVSHALKQAKAKLEKQTLEQEEAARFEWYNQIGNSLVGLKTPLKRGLTSAVIFNVYTQLEESVPLNPKLDNKGNAELYFKRAKKGKRGADVCLEKVADSKKEIEFLENILQQCTSIAEDLSAPESGPRLDKLEKEYQKYDPDTFKPTSRNAVVNQKVPYRHYQLENWDIYVGKNEVQNDELTTRFAKPADIWMHVAGHAGSHVIIRRPKGAEPPSRYVIEKVAALTVWFSKAKHTSFAEVHVTEARFVHKRRGSPAGEVIAERCKGIRVAPLNPQDLFPGVYD